MLSIELPILLTVIGIFSTSFFSLLAGIGIMLSPRFKKTEYLLVAYLFLNSVWIGLGGIAALELPFFSPLLLFKVSLLVYFLTMLSVNYYTLVITSREFEIKPIYLLHLIGPVIAITLFFVEADSLKVQDFQSLYYFGNGTPLFSVVTSLTLCVYFCIMIYRTAINLGNNWKEFTSSWVRMGILFLFGLFLSALWSVDKIYSLHYLWFCYFMAGWFPVIGGLMCVQDPEFIARLKDLYQQKKYAKTRITGIDVETTLEHINTCVLSQKVYKDSEITLKGLANAVDLSTHQLSELINGHLQKNFSSFINYYRIEEAKQLLENDKKMLLIEVAHEVGFKSVSSFNRVFKNTVGLSPSLFKKKVRKAS